MSQTELVFRGTGAEECREFISKIHQRAHELGRFRDNAWMADTAMAALNGDALKLFDEMETGTQGDWTLLRRELLQRYCSDESKLIPTAPKALPPPKRTVPAVVKDPLSKIIPSIPDRMHVRIGVEASGVDYTGYIAGFKSTAFGIACTLTRDPAKALPLLPTNGSRFDLQAIEYKNGQLVSSVVAPFGLSSVGSKAGTHGAVLARWVAITDEKGGFEYFSPTEDRKKIAKSGKNWTSNPYRFAWSAGKYGKLGYSKSDGTSWSAVDPSIKTIISKTSEGDLIVLFWKPRSWEKGEDPCVADLYLERFYE